MKDSPRETAVILACHRETAPDVIFIEGQASLGNPMGPCGSEMILAGGAKGVILQHAPAREFFDELVEIIKNKVRSGGGAVRISGISSWGEAVPLLQPYEIASIRIDAVDLFFLRILTDTGAMGVGSASPAEDVTGESPEACRTALSVKQLSWLEGRDPRDLDDLGRELEESQPATPAARAAVDMALHDLVARSEGVALVDLLGRCQDALPTSVTIGVSSVHETLAAAEEFLGRGFRNLKVKTGRLYEEDVERLTRLRECVGPEVAIRIDGNQGNTVQEARSLGDLAEGLNLELIEQPLPAALDSEMRTLPASIRRIIAADESLHAAYACPRTRYLDLDGSFDLARDPATGGFVVEEGCLRLLDRPGLGVDLSG